MKTGRNRLQLKGIFRIREACMYRLVGDSCLQILNLETRMRHQVDGLGAYIVLQFDGQRTLEDIIEQTTEEFGRTKVKPNDVLSFIEELVEGGVIEKKRGLSSDAKKVKLINLKKDKCDPSQLRLTTGFAYQSAAASAGCTTGT